MILSFKYGRQNRPGAAEHGFSLIETVVVIALVAIAAGMTVPNLLSHRPAWELNRAANDVYSNLQWARLTAIRENLRCRLTVDSTNNEYRIEKLDAAGNPITPPLRQIQIPTTYENSGITLSATGNGKITFNPQGTSNSITVTVLNSSGSFNVWPVSSGVIKKVRTS